MAQSIKLSDNTYIDASGVTIGNSGVQLDSALGTWTDIIGQCTINSNLEPSTLRVMRNSVTKRTKIFGFAKVTSPISVNSTLINLNITTSAPFSYQYGICYNCDNMNLYGVFMTYGGALRLDSGEIPAMNYLAFMFDLII